MLSAASDLFARSAPAVREAYQALLQRLGDLGAFEEQPKKTSIHLAAGTGFAGVHPQKAKFRLNIRTDTRLDSQRVRKVEQVSANRFHNEIDIAEPVDIDDELLSWLGRAYELASQKRTAAG